jgi:hypothetical protein
MIVLIAVVVLLVLAAGVFAAQLVARRATERNSAPVAAQDSKSATRTHPCNHGFYVSQAAHAKKGGKYVSGVARSNLGKDGNCSAKLPGS